jgi:rhodanese-related sulfurtransferase
MNQLVEFAANHPFLVAGLFAAAAAVLVYEIRLRQQGVTSISSADMVRLINSKGALIVDVRKAEAFEQGHIVNARNIELAKIAESEDAIGKQKSKVVVTVCDDGNQASRAAALLRNAGYENTFSLKDGLRSWRTENLPLVKS